MRYTTAVLCLLAIVLFASMGFGMTLPLSGDWNPTQDFGVTNNCWDGYHLGEDVVRSSEVAVYAIAAGHVKFAGQHMSGYGYPVIIEHSLPDGSKYCSLYGHLRQAGLIANDIDVVEGQIIGYLTSVSDDNQGTIHLHSGIRLGAYSSGTIYLRKPNINNCTVTGYTWQWNWQYGGYTRNANYTQTEEEPYDITHEIMKSQWRATSVFVAQNGQADVYRVALPTSQEGGAQFIDGVQTNEVTMVAGGIWAHFKVRYKNLCNFTWSKNQADPNWVGLMSCRSDGSTVCHSFLNDPWNSSLDWMSDADHAHVKNFSEANVPPGVIATFEFDGYIPEGTDPITDTSIYFSLHHATHGFISDGWGGLSFQVSVVDPEPEPDPYDDHSVGIVAGDFDNDGVVNDLASIYDYLGASCRIHVWCSNGSGFDYLTSGWWYISSGYPSENVRQVVAGDFDGDGYKDDIAALYDYGIKVPPNYRSCWHVWRGTGSGFVYLTGAGWWLVDGYNANLVIDAAAGDWDGDGDDDIAALYDYPGDESAIHVWLSTGSSFFYPSAQDWWFYLASGYPSQNVKFMVSGDWNNDGKDDLATFYNYGWYPSIQKYRTRIHCFLSDGTEFDYQGAGGWWTYDGYNLDSVTQAVSGDWDNDGKDDLATFYDYGQPAQNYLTKIHVWLSTGSAFSFQNIWWSSYGYNAQNVKFALPGYFNSDSYMEVMSAYDYGNETRFHVWLKSGSAFSYQGGGGWWSSTGFFLPKVVEGENLNGILPSLFTLNQNYPNPFNPLTVISYSLPTASDVKLEVFNILGQRVTTLVSQKQEAGEHTITWDASRFSSGVYFYRIQTAEAVETKKMLLLK